MRFLIVLMFVLTASLSAQTADISGTITDPMCGRPTGKASAETLVRIGNRTAAHDNGRPLAPTPCASEGAFRVCEECTDQARCETRVLMRQVRNAIAAVLDQTTLEQACSARNLENMLS